MTDLLRDGLSQHTVQKTPLTRKLTVDGTTEAYPVYRIKLDLLYYNDQNDRIATWISQYRSQHGGRAPEPADREAYNQIIEGFLVESNPDAIRKTKANIKLVDQREPGVVLNDGRIIDGNRRFTCLRQLSAEDPKFGWFEAVILDRSMEHSAKQIKLLELSIQHGEEGKVDYDPIDRLVGVYHDILETGLLSPEEYARSTNESVTDVKKRMELAELMVELLEFINAPGQFHIARELKLYYPLEELQKLQRDVPMYRGASGEQFLNTIYGDITVDAEESELLCENYTTIMNTVDKQRTSVSGVDEDEEALDLVKFQNAYNLCSKVVQVLSEMYDRLVTSTGV